MCYVPVEPYDPLGLLLLEKQFQEFTKDGVVVSSNAGVSGVGGPTSVVTASQTWYERLVYVRQPAPYYVGILQAEELLRTRNYLLAVTELDKALPLAYGEHRQVLSCMHQHLQWLANTYPR